VLSSLLLLAVLGFNTTLCPTLSVSQAIARRAFFNATAGVYGSFVGGQTNGTFDVPPCSLLYRFFDVRGIASVILDDAQGGNNLDTNGNYGIGAVLQPYDLDLAAATTCWTALSVVNVNTVLDWSHGLLWRYYSLNPSRYRYYVGGVLYPTLYNCSTCIALGSQTQPSCAADPVSYGYGPQLCSGPDVPFPRALDSPSLMCSRGYTNTYIQATPEYTCSTICMLRIYGGCTSGFVSYASCLQTCTFETIGKGVKYDCLGLGAFSLFYGNGTCGFWDTCLASSSSTQLPDFSASGVCAWCSPPSVTSSSMSRTDLGKPLLSFLIMWLITM
jgi:hypothetical protein